MMNESDLLWNLCGRDPRNPSYDDVYGFDDTPPVPRQDCACDGCFSGKDKLALEILRLQELNKELKELVHNAYDDGFRDGETDDFGYGPAWEVSDSKRKLEELSQE